jgi:hypothetical protein
MEEVIKEESWRLRMLKGLGSPSFRKRDYLRRRPKDKPNSLPSTQNREIKSFIPVKAT